MIETRAGGWASLNRHALVTLGVQYFEDGLCYMAAAHARASQLGGVDITPTVFAERYMPTMHAITDFRNIVLRLADDGIHEHRRAMLLVPMGSAGAAVSALGALAWIAISFRRNVMRPLVDITRLIDGIARGNLSTHIPTDFARRKIRVMFDAICMLRTNNIERRRLEVERVRLMQELSRMTEVDPLIQLLNRRTSEDRAGTMCKPPQPKARSTALTVFGTDHFKRINNTYGHTVGGEALRAVARLCRAEGPSADIVAHIGGEEFAVMAWADNPAQAHTVADRLRHHIAEVTTPTGIDLPCHMTTSFGVTTAPAVDGPQLGLLLRRADHLLHAAKLTGHSCVMADRLPASPDVVLTVD